MSLVFYSLFVIFVQNYLAFRLPTSIIPESITYAGDKSAFLISSFASGGVFQFPFDANLATNTNQTVPAVALIDRTLFPSILAASAGLDYLQSAKLLCFTNFRQFPPQPNQQDDSAVAVFDITNSANPVLIFQELINVSRIANVPMLINDCSIDSRSTVDTITVYATDTFSSQVVRIQYSRGSGTNQIVMARGGALAPLPAPSGEFQGPNGIAFFLRAGNPFVLIAMSGSVNITRLVTVDCTTGATALVGGSNTGALRELDGLRFTSRSNTNAAVIAYGASVDAGLFTVFTNDEWRTLSSTSNALAPSPAKQGVAVAVAQGNTYLLANQGFSPSESPFVIVAPIVQAGAPSASPTSATFNPVPTDVPGPVFTGPTTRPIVYDGLSAGAVVGILIALFFVLFVVVLIIACVCVKVCCK